METCVPLAGIAAGWIALHALIGSERADLLHHVGAAAGALHYARTRILWPDPAAPVWSDWLALRAEAGPESEPTGSLAAAGSFWSTGWVLASLLWMALLRVRKARSPPAVYLLHHVVMLAGGLAGLFVPRFRALLWVFTVMEASSVCLSAAKIRYGGVTRAPPWLTGLFVAAFFAVRLGLFQLVIWPQAAAAVWRHRGEYTSPAEQGVAFLWACISAAIMALNLSWAREIVRALRPKP